MTYRIDYLDAKGLIAFDHCNGTFAQAQRIAKDAIATRMADEVEVRDENDAIVFRCSRDDRRR